MLLDILIHKRPRAGSVISKLYMSTLSSWHLLSLSVCWFMVVLTSAYDPNGHTNVAMYFGQGPNQTEFPLQYFCENSDVDIIPLGFINLYQAQANGYPGSNFGSNCWNSNFTAPGYNGTNDPKKNGLKDKCPNMAAAIPVCQWLGKKVLLSIGGEGKPTPYALTSVSDATYLADFLWGAFGPYNPAANWPRPFDTAEGWVEVDGFDFDIEHITPGEQALYVILINRLRSYFPTGDIEYIVTGAPQCRFPDANMGEMISQVKFDALFIQYYNTPQCSARNWTDSNPKYSLSTTVENPSGFKVHFDALINSLAISRESQNAKVYIGLLASRNAGIPGDYLDPLSEIAPLVAAHFCNPHFGGISIFEAGYAQINVRNGKTFHQQVKDILLEDSIDTQYFSCATSNPAASKTVEVASSSTVTVTLCSPSTVLESSSIFLGNFSSNASWNQTAIHSLFSTVRSATIRSATVRLLTPRTTSAANSTSSDRSSIASAPAVTKVTPSPDPLSISPWRDSSSSSSLSPRSTHSTISSPVHSSPPKPTPTFSLNLADTLSSSGNNSNSACVIIILTLTIPSIPTVTAYPTTAGQGSATGSGIGGISYGSVLLLSLGVGVPGVCVVGLSVLRWMLLR